MGKTLQLTVKDQDGNVLTQGVTFASSAEGVATVDEAGLVTAIAEGNATITATYVAPQGTRAAGDEITAEFELTVTAAQEPGVGQVLTADGHTITLVGYHYIDTNNYELIITCDEQMTGLGGSFWNINGNEPTDIRTNMTISDDGKTITITATSTEDPQLYTPLYVLISDAKGEVNFGMVNIEWIEVAGIPTAINDLNVNSKNDNNWYNIYGMKIQGVPTVPGIYINGGKKVVVK